MKAWLKKLPVELRKVIHGAAKVSAETKMPAYLVGGCLRDLILKAKNFETSGGIQTPSFKTGKKNAAFSINPEHTWGFIPGNRRIDLDIAVEGSGIVFAQNLARKLNSNLKTHERFGTATLILGNRLKVDIATARLEEYPSPAALPVVRAGALKEDLKRRDFTINALALSLTTDKEQKIIDPFGGQDDLISGRIRILHNLSFLDDPTRIFRAIRFSQRFNFEIEPQTLTLLKEAISGGLLNKVNPHRLRDELILMLKEQEPFNPIKQLSDLGALSCISTKLRISRSTLGLFKSIAKETTWFVKKFPTQRQLDIWLIYFMALLEPLSLTQVKMIITRLGLRKQEENRLISYHQERRKLILALSKKRLLPERIFSLLEPLSQGMIILLRASSQNRNLKKYLADFFKIYSGVRLCVSGKDLKNLGVLPGPAYQKLLAQVLAAKLNGQVSGRQSELALIRKLVKTI
jgi:tRNA nucleotidyltransferase (CCA-adding enzyme)